MPNPVENFSDYASGFPPKIRALLKEMRQTIKKAAPTAEETISYNIPTFKVNGKMLVSYAAFKTHFGFYPGAAALKAFRKELAPYKTSKGSVQFPFDEPLPLDLVSRIVKSRMAETLARHLGGRSSKRRVHR
jgi:uncharacterized protein YdhG (YjbR/CyaY superfamily)